MKIRSLQTHKLIIVQRPELWIVSMLVLVLLLIMAIWYSYESGRRAAGFNSSDAANEVEKLQIEIANRDAQIAETQRQNAMLERNSQFDGNASEQLNDSLQAAQAEVLELKKELSFYRSIVSPEQAKRSVTIHTILLNEITSGEYSYKIMVAQRGRNTHIARGTMSVDIYGLEQGVEKKIGLYEISAKAKKDMRFGFKYFQNFEGILKIPTLFKPTSLRIKLQPSLKSIDPVDEKFGWVDLTTGE